MSPPGTRDLRESPHLRREAGEPSGRRASISIRHKASQTTDQTTSASTSLSNSASISASASTSTSTSTSIITSTITSISYVFFFYPTVSRPRFFRREKVGELALSLFVPSSARGKII